MVFLTNTIVLLVAYTKDKALNEAQLYNPCFPHICEHVLPLEDDTTFYTMMQKHDNPFGFPYFLCNRFLLAQYVCTVALTVST